MFERRDFREETLKDVTVTETLLSLIHVGRVSECIEKRVT